MEALTFQMLRISRFSHQSTHTCILRTREITIFLQNATPGLRKLGAAWTSIPIISCPGLIEDCLVAQTCAYGVQLSLYKTIQTPFFEPSELHILGTSKSIVILHGKVQY